MMIGWHGSSRCSSMDNLRTAVADRSAWSQADLKRDSSWQYRLSAAEKHALDDAVQATAHCSVSKVTRDLFDLGDLCQLIEFVRRYAAEDRGCFLLRGLPVKDKSNEDLERMIVGLSSHFGSFIEQDVKGSLVTRIQNTGLSYGDIAVVGGQTSAALTPHCDTGDFTILCCITTAQKGGTTFFVSSSSIFNEILRSHPKFLDLLFNGFHYNIRDRGPPGKWANVTRQKVPVFVLTDGKISCRFNQKAISTAQDWGLTPPLSSEESKAVSCVAELACRKDLRFGIKLQAGDLLILNNRSTLHYRSSFDDGESTRLLLRTWINAPDVRELPDEFTNHWNTGPRGGLYQRDVMRTPQN